MSPYSLIVAAFTTACAAPPADSGSPADGPAERPLWCGEQALAYVFEDADEILAVFDRVAWGRSDLLGDVVNTVGELGSGDCPVAEGDGYRGGCTTSGGVRFDGLWNRVASESLYAFYAEGWTVTGEGADGVSFEYRCDAADADVSDSTGGSSLTGRYEVHTVGSPLADGMADATASYRYEEGPWGFRAEQSIDLASADRTTGEGEVCLQWEGSTWDSSGLRKAVATFWGAQVATLTWNDDSSCAAAAIDGVEVGVVCE